jgi:hypothetical protein
MESKLSERSREAAAKPCKSNMTEQEMADLMKARSMFIAGILRENGLVATKEDLNPTVVALLNVAGLLSVGIDVRESEMLAAIECGREASMQVMMEDALLAKLKPVGSA